MVVSQELGIFTILYYFPEERRWELYLENYKQLNPTLSQKECEEDVKEIRHATNRHNLP